MRPTKHAVILSHGRVGVKRPFVAGWHYEQDRPLAKGKKTNAVIYEILERFRIRQNPIRLTRFLQKISDYIPGNTCHPGRLSPNSALCGWSLAEVIGLGEVAEKRRTDSAGRDAASGLRGFPIKNIAHGGGRSSRVRFPLVALQIPPDSQLASRPGNQQVRPTGQQRHPQQHPHSPLHQPRSHETG